MALRGKLHSMKERAGVMVRGALGACVILGLCNPFLMPGVLT